MLPGAKSLSVWMKVTAKILIHHKLHGFCNSSIYMVQKQIINGHSVKWRKRNQPLCQYITSKFSKYLLYKRIEQQNMKWNIKYR